MYKRSRDRSRRRGGGISIAAIVNPLRTIATNNRVAINPDRVAALGYQAVRHRYLIAADASEFVLNFNNWFMKSSGESLAGDAAVNDLTLIDMSIEDPSGTVVPVYKGGLRSFLLAANAYDINTDPVYPSAFGKTKFTAGEIYAIKMKINVGVGGYTPYPALDTSSTTGLQVLWYDAAATTLSSTDIAGIYTSTGTAPATRGIGLRPILLGRPLVDGPSYLCVGDSIGQGQGDDSTAGISSPGFVNRAMHNGSNGGTLRPLLNLSKAGIQTILNQVKRKSLYKYAKYAIDQIGANDLGANASTTNLATVQTNQAAQWAEYRAAGIQKIIRTTLFPRVNSSNPDSYTTLANQTILGGWGVGEKGQQMNDWYLSKKADGTIDHVVQMTSGRGSRVPTDTDYWKWAVNGTANYSTGDGTHAWPAGTVLYANDLRDVLVDLELANGFTPDSISKGAIRLDYRFPSSIAIRTSGADVFGVQWTDLFSGIPYIQPTSGSQPRYGQFQLNGKDVFTFDGVDDVLYASGRNMSELFDATGSTLFVVKRFKSGTVEFAFSENSNNKLSAEAGNRVDVGNDSTSKLLVPGTTNTWVFVSIRRSATKAEVWYNGVLQASVSNTDTLSALSTTFAIGALNAALNLPSNIDFASKYAYKKAASDAEMLGMHTYLKAATGLT